MDPQHPRPTRLPDPLLRRQSLVAQIPYLSCVRAPSTPARLEGPGKQLEVATYNVHRWTGISGGRRFVPELACEVVHELGADVVALQEVLRPFDRENPLVELAAKQCRGVLGDQQRLGLHPPRCPHRGRLLAR